jgi:hypothetical protein
MGTSNVRIIVELSIDGDLKLRLYESEPARLSDPSALFVPLFESLGLPASLLGQLRFDEEWIIANMDSPN